MAAPPLSGVDHVHVMVRDRAAAQKWYREVLGFLPVAELEVWQGGGGPLTLADALGKVHLALFEHEPAPQHKSVVALGTDARGFVLWRDHLSRSLGRTVEVVDHDLALSLYFRDPDGNPYEITTYEAAAARAGLSTSS